MKDAGDVADVREQDEDASVPASSHGPAADTQALPGENREDTSEGGDDEHSVGNEGAPVPFNDDRGEGDSFDNADEDEDLVDEDEDDDSLQYGERYCETDEFALQQGSAAWRERSCTFETTQEPPGPLRRRHLRRIREEAAMGSIPLSLVVVNRNPNSTMASEAAEQAAEGAARGLPAEALGSILQNEREASDAAADVEWRRQCHERRSSGSSAGSHGNSPTGADQHGLGGIMNDPDHRAEIAEAAAHSTLSDLKGDQLYNALCYWAPQDNDAFKDFHPPFLRNFNGQKSVRASRLPKRRSQHEDQCSSTSGFTCIATCPRDIDPEDVLRAEFPWSKAKYDPELQCSRTSASQSLAQWKMKVHDSAVSEEEQQQLEEDDETQVLHAEDDADDPCLQTLTSISSVATGESISEHASPRVSRHHHKQQRRHQQQQGEQQQGLSQQQQRQEQQQQYMRHERSTLPKRERGAVGGGGAGGAWRKVRIGTTASPSMLRRQQQRRRDGADNFLVARGHAVQSDNR